MKQNLLPAKTRFQTKTFLVLLPVMILSGCVADSRDSHAQPTAESPPAAKAHPNPRININKASAQDLEKLPGIGMVLAERIVAHRHQNGPFRRVEHLMLVMGISEKKFYGIEGMITVE